MRLLASLFAGALGLAISTGSTAWAQSYPSKPVNVISAFPPTTLDFILRLVNGPFQEKFKQALVIENRPGAGGNIAAEAVARSAPDGYTLLVTTDTVVTSNPHMYRNLNFKADVELVPVIYLANTSQTLVCDPSVPVKSVLDLVTYAKSHDMSYASGGKGVPGHLAAEMFLAATGLRMTHVPYKGPNAAVQGMIEGKVQCGFLSTAVVMPYIKSGTLPRGRNLECEGRESCRLACVSVGGRCRLRYRRSFRFHRSATQSELPSGSVFSERQFDDQ